MVMLLLMPLKEVGRWWLIKSAPAPSPPLLVDFDPIGYLELYLVQAQLGYPSATCTKGGKLIRCFNQQNKRVSKINSMRSKHNWVVCNNVQFDRNPR